MYISQSCLDALRSAMKKQQSYVRNQKYYDELAKQLENGLESYNSKTGKTTLANKHFTIVIDGSLPEDVKFNGGQLTSSYDKFYVGPDLYYNNITGKSIVSGNKPICSPLQMRLFATPNPNSRWQRDLMDKIRNGIFVEANDLSTEAHGLQGLLEKYTGDLHKTIGSGLNIKI